MAMTDEEQRFVDSKYSKRELQQLEKMVDDLHAIYLLTDRDKGKLYRKWMHDSERFMGFLVIHSIILVSLTRWLKWLTILLAALTLVHIFFILDEAFGWF